MSFRAAQVCFVFACLIAGALGGRYSGQLSAQSPGDDPSASGLLNLQTTRDAITFNSTLFNSFDVTGVHLHLSSPRGAVFGGPLILALTNTTTANGQAPVSSNNGPLIQNGQKFSSDLANNPMLTMVRSQLQSMGVTGNNVETIGDVANLIEDGLVYSDVHTIIRVSPDGLVRGKITELACPFPSPNPPSGGTPTSPTPTSPTPTSPSPTTPTSPPSSPSPSPPPSGTPSSPPPSTPSTVPPAPTNLGNPCYCTPQQGVGSDGFQYCFNFVEGTTAINCNPPSGARCSIYQASDNEFTNEAGPVFQCSY